MEFFDKLKSGLSKTRANFTDRMEDLVGVSVDLDEDFMDEMEMILVAGDVGVKTTEKIMAALRKAAYMREIKKPQEALPFIKKYIAGLLTSQGPRMNFSGNPSVVLVVGVNGVGKTTTIGKLANYYRMMGYKVMIAAADTFRAAATEQLKIWGERAQVEVIAHGEGADPAGPLRHLARGGGRLQGRHEQKRHRRVRARPRPAHRRPHGPRDLEPAGRLCRCADDDRLHHRRR